MKRAPGIILVMFLLLVVGCGTAQKQDKKEKKVVRKTIQVTNQPKEPEDWAKYYTKKGLDALQLKNGKADFKTAISYLKKAVKAYPTSPTLLYNLGLTYQRTGDNKKALEYYNKALELNPKYSRPVVNKAAMYANKLEYNRAIEVCETFLEENEQDKIVLSAEAGFYLQKGDYISAIQSVRKILIQDQKDVDALKNLGMIYYKKKDTGLATMVTVNTLSISKDDAGIANNRGVLFASKGDHSRAMLYFNNALNIEPTNKAANFNMGSIAMQYGDANTAFERFSMVLAQDPDSIEGRIGVALALRGQAKFADSEKEYQKVLDTDPNNAIATFNLGVLYYDHMNKKVEAKRLFRKYLSLAEDVTDDDIVHKYLKDEVKIRPSEDDEDE